MTHKNIIGIIFNVGTTKYSYSTILQYKKMELLSVYYVVIYIFSVYKKKLAVTFFIKERFTKLRITNIFSIKILIYYLMKEKK